MYKVSGPNLKGTVISFPFSSMVGPEILGCPGSYRHHPCPDFICTGRRTREPAGSACVYLCTGRRQDPRQRLHIYIYHITVSTL
jgi:hypothetical protein